MILKTAPSGRSGIRLNGWPWLMPAFFLLLWYVAAYARWMPEQILPAPGVVADTALSLLRADLLGQWAFSLRHLALGLLLGAIIGTVLGALFGLVPGATTPRGAALLCAGADPDAGLDPPVYGAVRD